MQPLLQNKYFRYGRNFFILLFVVLIIAALILGSLNDARSGQSNSVSSYGVDSFAGGRAINDSVTAETYYAPEQPRTGNYTSDLETYETTSYAVTARTKQFDELCSTLTRLKAEDTIYFKQLRETTNNCSATFYVEGGRVTDVLSALTTFQGVEYTRDTDSVTRHRRQIQSQTAILVQQLASVERTLQTTETQFDDIANFARENNDAATLSQAVQQKLILIDDLTQRKISLTDRLNRSYQQAADLEQRMNVVEFSVSINRSVPLYPDKYSAQWERAWDDLRDSFTDTLIGVTATLGVFLLWSLQVIIYLLIGVVILRGLWKFIRFMWKK